MTGRIERLEREFEITVKWRAFPLHPEIPAEGVLLKEYFAGRLKNIDQMIDWMKQTALSLGLPFGEVSRIYNTRLAQELGCWAESENKGAAFHNAAFAAYFVEGNNLADRSVLEKIAVSAGLDGETAKKVVTQNLFKDLADSDWNLAAENAVTAVPTLMLNQDRLVGAQPYEKLKNLMLRHNIPVKEAIAGNLRDE